MDISSAKSRVNLYQSLDRGIGGIAAAKTAMFVLHSPHPTIEQGLTASSNCCNLRNMVTVKISEDARTLLRILAANKGKTMHDVAEDLFWAEAKRLKLSIRSAVKNRNKAREKR